MKSLIKDESADSMIIVVIVLGVLMFGLTYILLSHAFNPSISVFNSMIDKGMLSDDTFTHVATTLDLWKCAPFFWILGTILWCFERSKGGSISSNSYFEYLVLMCITLLISVYLTWGFGSTLDALCKSFETEMFSSYGAEWDVSSTRNLCVILVYYAAMSPGFLGSLLFVLHPILRQRENSMLDGSSEESAAATANGEYITNYSLDQF